MEATAHPRVMPIAYVQANAVFARGWTIRWRDIEARRRPRPGARGRPSFFFLPPSSISPLNARPPLPPFLPSLHQKTLRDLLLPVVIVFALIVLEVIIGEESLPALPKLPAVDTACDPYPPGANVSRCAVCWYYPVRATH